VVREERGETKGYLAFAICVIVLGALISLLQVLEAVPWVRYLTAALGAAVTISRAVDTLLRPGARPGKATARPPKA
jgi:hypothetical protein